MHRSEGYDRASCLQCGAEISISKDRGYVVGDDAVLCLKCALERGGSYDELHDTWTQAPRLDGLSLPDDTRIGAWR